MVRMRRTGGTAQKSAERTVQEVKRTIYAYCNVQTNQVLYSRWRSLDSYQVLKQLPDLGANLKPTKIRKDLWKPLWTLSLPDTPHAKQQSLLAFRKLREWRKLHETNWTPPPELSRLYTEEEIEKIQKQLDERGGSKKESPHDIIKQRKRLMRKRIVMDQKANSVADLAAVLQELEDIGNKRQKEQNQMLDEQRSREVAEMLKLHSHAQRGGVEALEKMLQKLEPVLQRSDEETMVLRDQGEDLLSKRSAKRQAYKLQKKKQRMMFTVEAMKDIKEEVDRVELGAEMTRGEANTWLSESRQRIQELESSSDAEERSELHTLQTMTDIVVQGRNMGEEQVRAQVEKARALLSEKPNGGKEEMEFQAWRIALATVRGLPAEAKSRKQILDEQKEILKARKEALAARWKALEEERKTILDGPLPKLDRQKERLTNHITILEKNIADLIRARDERKKHGMDEHIRGLEAKKKQVVPTLRGLETAMSLFQEEGGFEKLQRAGKDLHTPLANLDPNIKNEEVERLLCEKEGFQLVITALSARVHSLDKPDLLKESRDLLNEADTLQNAEEPIQHYRTHLELQLPKPWRLDWNTLLPSFPAPEKTKNLPKRGIERQKHKRLHAPVFSLEGVKVKWANPLDAEYAAKWPSSVAIEPMGWSRNTAPRPQEADISDVATWKAKKGSHFRVDPIQEGKRRAVLEEIKREVMAKVEVKRAEEEERLRVKMEERRALREARKGGAMAKGRNEEEVVVA